MASIFRSRYLASTIKLMTGSIPRSSVILKRTFINPSILSYNRPLVSTHFAKYSIAAPITQEDIATRVLNVCKEYEKIKQEQLDLNSHFMNDLGLDSLDHVEVIMAVEDEFGFEIPETVSEKLFSPKDIVEHVFKELTKN